MNKIFRESPNPTLSDNITFVITDDCNLRCRYCYETKKEKHDMTLDTGKKAIDYFMFQWQNRYDTVIFDFIGGEPFVCIDLVNKMTEYLVEQFKKQNKWKDYILSFSTNGTCFKDPKVREYIAKYHDHISVGLSLDGCKAIHDYNRNDSFDEVMKWFPYWRRNFPCGGTKSTLNHEAIPYVYESIKFLTSTCLEDIFMNTVYEDVWQPGDDKLFYDQLLKTADYLLDYRIYKKKQVSLFSSVFLMDVNNDSNWCGCGSCMIAVDYLGNLYPCLRFKTLSKRPPLSIGNIFVDNGKLDYKKLLPFYFCHNTQNTERCDTCEARKGCPNCTGFCYDETGSIFDRTFYMCDMHIARKKANDYYWRKMARIEGIDVKDLLFKNRED